nr:unnamed protein product [Digitaria exilis]
MAARDGLQLAAENGYERLPTLLFPLPRAPRLSRPPARQRSLSLSPAPCSRSLSSLADKPAPLVSFTPYLTTGSRETHDPVAGRPPALSQPPREPSGSRSRALHARAARDPANPLKTLAVSPLDARRVSLTGVTVRCRRPSRHEPYLPPHDEEEEGERKEKRGRRRRPRQGGTLPLPGAKEELAEEDRACAEAYVDYAAAGDEEDDAEAIPSPRRPATSLHCTTARPATRSPSFSSPKVRPFSHRALALLRRARREPSLSAAMARNPFSLCPAVEQPFGHGHDRGHGKPLPRELDVAASRSGRRAASPRLAMPRTHSCASHWLAHANAPKHTHAREHATRTARRRSVVPLRHSVERLASNARGHTPLMRTVGHTALAARDRRAAAADPGPRLVLGRGPRGFLAREPSRAQPSCIDRGGPPVSGVPPLTSWAHVLTCGTH